ncbi:hypothetical protein KCU73_g6977, partial [Aureobasidium melanogenum]
EETMGQDVVQDHPEVVAPSEDIVQVTGNTRTEQSWPFNELPNLVRHVPNANQTEQIGAPIKDEPNDASPAIDAPPTVNMTLRRQYAESWGTPQVKRGELTKVKFGVNYEKAKDSYRFGVPHMHRILNYRPDWQMMSKQFLEAFPPLEILSFTVDREDGSATTASAGESPCDAEPSGALGHVEGTTATAGPSSLNRHVTRTVPAQGRPPPPQTSNSRISRAQARYEDLIAQRNAFVAVRNRRLEKAKRNTRYYDSDFEETPEIEPPVDNERSSFRPPSPAVPPIMDEVASDGYASSCDEHEIHRSIINSTKRTKPAKVKKGHLIQAKMVLRGPNGATVNAINGKPGVTRTLRVPANTSFRQLTDVLNTAFGWAGDKEWDSLIASSLGKWPNLEPPPAQFVARVKKSVTTSIFDRVWYNYHAGSHWAHQISFLGEVNDRLFEASRMEADRKYWCIAGEGHAHPEDHPGKLDKWRGKTNLWAWDTTKINKETGLLEENSLHNR